MSEIDLIIKYLNLYGAVSDVLYKEFHKDVVDTDTVNIPSLFGLQQTEGYAFGNFDFFSQLSSVTLGNSNLVRWDCNTYLKGFNITNCHVRQAPFMGMDNEGGLAGVYMGTKRIYGKGMNWVQVVCNGLGGASFAGEINFNGYLFVMR